MNSFFDTLADRIGTACIKWDFREEEFGNADVLPFSIADADFAMMPEISDALIGRIGKGVLGYTDLDENYYSAVRKWFSERHGLTVRNEWITSTAGIIPAIGAAIGALLEPGDRVVIQTPVYDPFESVIRANGCISEHNCLVCDGLGRYSMDYEDLGEKLQSGAKMLILCSPHNPVGRVWTTDELSRVLELCRSYGVILVSDEIHWDIINPEFRHISMGALVNDEDKFILCTAPSKTFNIAGLQASNIVIRNKEIRDKFQSWLFSRYMFGANVLGLTACVAAYENGAEWVDEQNRYIAANAAAAEEFIKEHLPKAVVSPLEGTYLMWIDMRYLGKTSDELVAAIIRAGAGLNSGHHYGEQCDGYVRMNIACPREILMKGLESIRKAAVEIERNH